MLLRDLQEDSSGKNFISLIIAIVAAVALLILICRRGSSLPRPPEGDALVVQQRLQRYLIAQSRLRRLGLYPQTAVGADGFELTAEKAETKRKEWLQWFTVRGLQRLLAETDFVDGQSMDRTTDQGKKGSIRVTRNLPSYSDQVTSSQCVICMDAYVQNETVVFSNNKECTHCLHQECALDYLVLSHKQEKIPCPVCRRQLAILDVNESVV